MQSENARKKILPLADDTPAIKAQIEYLNAYGKGKFSDRMDEIRLMRYQEWLARRNETAYAKTIHPSV